MPCKAPYFYSLHITSMNTTKRRKIFIPVKQQKNIINTRAKLCLQKVNYYNLNNRKCKKNLINRKVIPCMRPCSMAISRSWANWSGKMILRKKISTVITLFPTFFFRRQFFLFFKFVVKLLWPRIDNDICTLQEILHFTWPWCWAKKVKRKYFCDWMTPLSCS